MDCHTIRTRLLRYLDDDLGPAERVLVEHHVGKCFICQEELNDTSAVLDACREAMRHPHPVDGYPALEAVVRADTSGPTYRRPRRWTRTLATVLTAAACYIMVFNLLSSIWRISEELVRLSESMTESSQSPASEAVTNARPLSLMLAWKEQVVENLEAPSRTQAAAEDSRPPGEPEPAEQGAASPVSHRETAQSWALARSFDRSGPQKPFVYWNA